MRRLDSIPADFFFSRKAFAKLYLKVAKVAPHLSMNVYLSMNRVLTQKDSPNLPSRLALLLCDVSDNRVKINLRRPIRACHLLQSLFHFLKFLHFQSNNFLQSQHCKQDFYFLLDKVQSV